MSERGSVVRGCATIVGLLLTGVLALVVWTVIRLQPESQPDVAKAAQSATARAADQQLTTRVARRRHRHLDQGELQHRTAQVVTLCVV